MAELVPTTLEEREMMEHALGIQVKCGQKTKGGYRNYFAAGPGRDTEIWNGLVEKGLAVKGQSRWGDDYFHVTDAGKKEVGFHG